MHLNHPKPSLLSQVLKNCLPQNWPLVPKSLGTAAYADIPYVDLFFTEDHEKAQLLISPLIFIRKNKYWETLKPHKHSWLFSLKWQASFVHFIKECLLNTQVGILIVCLVIVLCLAIVEKNVGLVCSSSNHTGALLWHSHHTSGYSKRASCTLRVLSDRILRRHLFKGRDLIQLIIITASSKIFLNVLLFSC